MEIKCEGSEILPYLQTNKLAAGFMSAGRRRYFWVRDKGQFVTHNSCSQGINLPPLPSSQPPTPWPRTESRWHLHTQWVALQERNPKKLNPPSWAVRRPALSSGENAISTFPGWSLYKYFPKDNLKQREWYLCLQGVQECERPRQNYLPTGKI